LLYSLYEPDPPLPSPQPHRSQPHQMFSLAQKVPRSVFGRQMNRMDCTRLPGPQVLAILYLSCLVSRERYHMCEDGSSQQPMGANGSHTDSLSHPYTITSSVSLSHSHTATCSEKSLSQMFHCTELSSGPNSRPPGQRDKERERERERKRQTEREDRCNTAHPQGTALFPKPPPLAATQ